MSRSVLDRAVFFGRSLLRLGYVRVTFGALYVASQYSCRAELLQPVEIPQVQFLARVVRLVLLCRS